MPTYEYACTSCGEHLEVVQSFSDEPLSTCPNCRGPLRKVFGSIGIVLKGSGFYKTDNRRNGSTGKTSEPAASAKSEPSSTDKSPSSPASGTAPATAKAATS